MTYSGKIALRVRVVGRRRGRRRRVSRDCRLCTFMILSADIGETKNIEGQHPEIVAAMETLLKKYIDDGRSTPGAAQKNDVPIDIWKLSDTAETGAAAGD